MRGPESGDWEEPGEWSEDADGRREPPEEWGAEPDPWEEDWPDEGTGRWPLTWRGLLPRERWLWFEHLWGDVCALRERYRLAVRSGWWEDEIQIEALAALAAWVDRFDSGEWDDPPGKLALLYDLPQVAALLRDGIDPFSPERDRPAFLSHLIGLGCQPPPAAGMEESGS